MCAKRSPLRAQRCAARGQRLCVRRPTRPRMWQVLREQEGARVYSELQSKHRAAYGDDEAAREAAGKAALLRAKESLSEKTTIAKKEREKTATKLRYSTVQRPVESKSGARLAPCESPPRSTSLLKAPILT